MRTRRLGCMALMAVGLVVGWVGNGAAAKPSKAQECEADKLEAVGKKAECLAKGAADEVLGKTPNIAKCDEEFTKAFTKAESKAGPGVCPTEGDTAAIEAQVDACVADIAAALSGTPPPPTCQQFPATGQTTCWNSTGTVITCPGTGQDGDIKAGAALSYTDNGDGTITDNNTGLMWAKKDDNNAAPLHYQDTLYTWADAFAVHIAGLNAGAFATYTDWRLPNVKELQSIVNYENVNPAVSPAFNTGCAASCTVLTCSCTVASFYWASSSFANGPAFAWGVFFSDGSVDTGNKSVILVFVRAVRGGS